jgi:HK97 family phage major capsid protein
MPEEVKEIGATDLAKMIADATAESNKALLDAIKDLGESQRKSVLPAPDKRLAPWQRSKEEIEEKRKEWASKHRNPNRLPPEDEFSFARFFMARKTNNWDLAPFEKYACETTYETYEGDAQKALGWASGSSGGYWVGIEFLPQEFIDYFTAEVVCRQAGCMVLPCTGAPVNIPKATAGHTVYWVTQNANITASDSTPGQLQLTPHWAVARCQLSRFLARTSVGAAESFVRQDMARGLALAVDDAMLEGPGTSGKPTGMSATASINTVAIGTNGGAMTSALLHSMDYAMNLDNVPMNGRVWIMHPRTWNAIRQLVTESGTTKYLINPNPSVAEPRSFLGYPVYLSTQVTINGTKGNGTALARVFLVNIKDIVLAEWGAIELEATDVGGNAWAQNAVEIKATYTVDVGVRNANSVCLLSDTTS